MVAGVELARALIRNQISMRSTEDLVLTRERSASGRSFVLVNRIREGQRTNEERMSSQGEEDDEEHEIEQDGANDSVVSDASDEREEERDVHDSERETEDASSDDWGAEEEQHWRELLGEPRRDISRNF